MRNIRQIAQRALKKSPRNSMTSAAVEPLMTATASRTAKRFAFWAKDDRGSVVVDFAIMMPIFLTIMLSGVEMGMMTVRQMLLERGLDMAVRDLRLGAGAIPQHDAIKTEICNYAGFLPDCMRSLKLEMRPMDMRNYTSLPNKVDCVDRSETVNPVREFTPGGSNQMMVMRACIKIGPIFPNVGLGSAGDLDKNGDLALFSVSAFVNEPSGS